MSTLRVAADFSLLNNSNPDPSVKLDFSSKVESASVFWTPNGAKWANLLVDYSRSAIHSSILYLVPETLSPATSIYKENAHSFTAVAAMKWFSFGGSLFISSGSRPTNYYQPLARVSIPINKHVQWNTEWRWYSMSEAFFAFENFQQQSVDDQLAFNALGRRAVRGPCANMRYSMPIDWFPLWLSLRVAAFPRHSRWPSGCGWRGFWRTGNSAAKKFWMPPSRCRWCFRRRCWATICWSCWAATVPVGQLYEWLFGAPSGLHLAGRRGGGAVPFHAAAGEVGAGRV